MSGTFREGCPPRSHRRAPTRSRDAVASSPACRSDGRFRPQTGIPPGHARAPCGARRPACIVISEHAWHPAWATSPGPRPFWVASIARSAELPTAEAFRSPLSGGLRQGHHPAALAHSARSRSSFSQNSGPAVNWTLYRAGANGSIRGGGEAGETDARGGTRSGPSPLGAVDDVPVASSGGGCPSNGSLSGRGIGNARIDSGTSGRGASSATNSSICRFDRWTARARMASQFSSVRCGASFAMPVRWRRPSSSISSSTGYRRAVRPDLDAQVGLLVRQVQQLCAVREHRGEAFARIQPSVVGLRDVRDEPRLDTPRLLQQLGQAP